MEKTTFAAAQGRRETRRSPQTDFEAKVTEIIVELMNGSSPSPTIAAVAARLRMNIRTLQRHLEHAGIPFRSLLSECRQQRAFRELREGNRPIREVASRLGYSDPAHFARAFRRWTGRSPSEYRRQVTR